MADHCNCYVHPEGEPETLLFRLPPFSREMREGDEFTYTDPSGTTVYKVESVDYRVELLTPGTPTHPDTFWKASEVHYEVSVVS